MASSQQSGATGSAVPGSWPTPPNIPASNRSTSPRPSHGGSPAPARSRHGSGARFGVHLPGSPGRERDDSPHSRARPVPAAASYRAVPAGQQEELDWAQALDRVSNTTSTSERHVRNHAQGLSALEEKVNQLVLTVDGAMNTIAETASRAIATERHLGEACNNIMARYRTNAEGEAQTAVIL